MNASPAALVSAPLAIAVILLVIAALADVAGRTKAGRLLGAAFIAVMLGAALANAGILPSAAEGGPVYDEVFTVIAPASLFLLLLDANYRALRNVGRTMLVAFAVGAVGVVVGVFIAFAVTPARELLSPHGPAIAGMLAGTYIGGSPNYNAVALQYGVVKAPQLYAAGVVVDNVMTNLWMLVTMVSPALLLTSRFFQTSAPADPQPIAAADDDTAPASLLGLAVPMAAAFGALWLAGLAKSWLGQLGFDVPPILILTVFGIGAAQVPGVERLTLAKPLGLLGIFLFLAVVGASADVGALWRSGEVGLLLFGFISIVFVSHAVVLLIAGALLKLDPDVLAVSSAANIGGSSTALAVAEVRNRPDLVAPGVVAGLIGTAVGTFIGIAVASLLLA